MSWPQIQHRTRFEYRIVPLLLTVHKKTVNTRSAISLYKENAQAIFEGAVLAQAKGGRHLPGTRMRTPPISVGVGYLVGFSFLAVGQATSSIVGLAGFPLRTFATQTCLRSKLDQTEARTLKFDCKICRHNSKEESFTMKIYCLTLFILAVAQPAEAIFGGDIFGGIFEFFRGVLCFLPLFNTILLFCDDDDSSSDSPIVDLDPTVFSNPADSRIISLSNDGTVSTLSGPFGKDLDVPFELNTQRYVIEISLHVCAYMTL